MHFMAMKKSRKHSGFVIYSCFKGSAFYRLCVFCSAALSIISILYPFSFVIIYNFTKGHNISLPRCAPLLLSIISFSVN